MTVSSKTLELLFAAGVTGDALVAIVRSIEEDVRPKTAAAERQKRYRARQRDVTGDVTGDVSSSPLDGPPSSGLLPPLNPPTPSAPPSGEAVPTASKRGTRIPDAFPRNEDVADAVDRGLSRNDAKLEAEKFRNYWLGKSGASATKVDWAATWRNWFIKAIEDRVNSRSRGPPAGGGYGAIAREFAQQAMFEDGNGGSEN